MMMNGLSDLLVKDPVFDSGTVERQVELFVCINLLTPRENGGGTLEVDRTGDISVMDEVIKSCHGV